MTPPSDRLVPTSDEFVEAQHSASFNELRSKFRRFTFPLTALFLLWFLLYLLVAMYIPDFMATSVFGNVNVGILFGLLQFVTTFVITWAYIRFANKTIEPLATSIRCDLEDKAREHIRHQA